MTLLNIPKDDLLVLKTIAELEESKFAALASALRDSKPSLTREQFVTQIAEVAKSIQQPEMRSILKVVFTLYALNDRMRISSKELANVVTKSAVQSSVKEVPFPSDKVGLLSARLDILLSFGKSIGVSAKAWDVLTEHERIFCGARILSDLRPVFAESLETASASVIVHNLQIGFHQNGKHQDFYVALDTDDVQALKEVIVRAEKKTIALCSILKKANVDYLEA